MATASDTASGGTPYSLPRTSAESSLLELQHSIYVATTGYLLRPSIAHTLPSIAAIADVGTGTGIWLRDLAAQQAASHPDWTYTGFDISSAQFPPPDDKPSVCSLNILDILDRIPKHWRARFDVVHLRLLICGLTGSDWATTAANAYTLLKPGGSIQWHECDFGSMQIVRSIPDASTEAMTCALQLCTEAQQREHRFLLSDTQNLVHTVRSAGFEHCDEDVFSSNGLPELRSQLVEVMFTACHSLSEYAVKKYPDLGVSEQEFEGLMERVREELKNAYFMFDMRVITGRKPIH